MEDGHVLVVTSDVDVARLEMLVTHLAAEGLSVVLGPGVGDYPSWAQQHDAAVLLLAVGGEGVPSPLPYTIMPFAEGGQAAAVTLADPSKKEASRKGDVSEPTLPHFALGNWSGIPTAEYQRLVRYLRALVNGGLVFSYGQSLDDANIAAARASVEELKSLTSVIGTLGDVLSNDDQRSQAVRETLAEVGSTYRVVKEAIVEFIAAGHAIDGRGVEAYAALAHGELRRAIHNGRAHCTRIGVRYERVGGLRDSIKARLPAAALAVMNDTFDRLATADGDLFQSMEMLGETLTTEARVVERLLLTDQKEKARSRVALAAKRLTNLEDTLDDALHAFQRIESELGYAEPVATEGEVANVTNQSITVYGNVVNSAIVAAKTIEGSSIRVVGSDAREDIKAVLLELHKATAEMTTHLPDDEAELAASVLEDLAREATSPSPRPKFWRRAADGLLDAAKKVADVGLPVVELVTKLTALLS